MDVAAQVTAALLAGLAIGAVVALGVSGRLARRLSAPAPAAPSVSPVAPTVSPELARRVLEVMSSGAVVLGSADDVVLVNPAARAMGVLRSGRLILSELRGLAREARRDGESRDVIVDLPRGRLGREPLAVRALVAPLAETGYVALLLHDVTESRRLEAVRRDFVANVSHELKTPVGALTLLAEAVQDAADDPVAVRRFAERMQHEGIRLGRLVAELIELSRLQGADPLPSPAIVEVDDVVAEAVDRTRLAAESGGIVVVSGGERGLAVRGSEPQLVTALVNLVDNGIAYSAPGTRIAVGTRRREGYVEISVSDQGIGIAERDLERVFERFYRADPARSRATGGTGLGLAIVKHIASNHGGSVSVWSVEGSGSTFTLRLPAAVPRPGDVTDDLEDVAAPFGDADPAYPVGRDDDPPGLGETQRRESARRVESGRRAEARRPAEVRRLGEATQAGEAPRAGGDARRLGEADESRDATKAAARRPGGGRPGGEAHRLGAGLLRNATAAERGGNG